MDTSAPALPQGRRLRRQYSTEFRVQVIEAASQPGVSVAAIALANGMNANLLRRWISMARGREMMIGAVTATSPAVQGFVPLATPEPHAYLKDILERLPTHPANRIEELLPYNWQPPKLAD